MKKLISVVVMLAFTSITVFAAPGAMALAQDGADDLFADVQATPLTAEEAQAVEGEGPVLGALAAAAVARFNPGGYVEKAIYTEQSKPNSGFSETRAKVNAVGAGIIVNALIVLVASSFGP
jgi:hypothetical protein